MSIRRTFYCDGPDCDLHVETGKVRTEHFLTITGGHGYRLHFCSWDCILRHAATKEPAQIIYAGDPDKPEEHAA